MSEDPETSDPGDNPAGSDSEVLSGELTNSEDDSAATADVDATAFDAAGDTLPFTGLETGPLALLGSGAMASGALLLLMARRREDASA